MENSGTKEPGKTVTLPRVVVATTAMLTFISFWRAAAIVLNDLASSAFYAGGIAEEAVGKSAPWFILGIMLFSYAVRAIYVESCSMFVRGGVYRVVKEAMGGTLAKFSVSALMFDYVLTGPISGVSAGQYLAGFLNESLRYLHIHLVLSTNTTAELFAILVTLYFWWENVKGIPESSEKSLRIMQLTTVMVVLMIGWCGYTLWVRGGHLPPLPALTNFHFAPEALGWLRHSRLPHTIGLIGILIGLGHSVLAMSGEESLAQVYREIEHPKLPNLKKAGLIIFIYSMVFTSLVSFFAVMIIPDNTRTGFFENLIGGLAMNVAGPLTLRLVFHGFVVLVGTLILAGGVNTAIVGSNGVLNRVSEDGVLAAWFRRPHPRFGTSYRIINLVVALQLLTIILSHGNVYLLGEAYAFGVVWSFVMKGLAVLVLRYKQPGPREFHVPLNFKLGKTEIPVGLGLITLTLLAIAIMNLFTKQVATISGVAFTLVLFGVFTASERIGHRKGIPHTELDQFHLAAGEDITPKRLGCRPGNILVFLRDYNTLYPLERVLKRVNLAKQDVVVLHIRVLMRAGSGESGLTPDQFFGTTEQFLFTRALSLAEHEGKTIHLALVAVNDVWDGILRAAQSLESSAAVLGLSAKMAITEEARRAGVAWERLPEPKPHLTLEIFTPTGQEGIFFLGPHAPHLTPMEIDLLHGLWLRFSDELAPEELHHHDIVHFALNELKQELTEGKDDEVRKRLRKHLEEIKSRRVPEL
ncbi:MAG: APC family permease [Terriglobia bacterium]|jgi:amino acid transporter